MRLLHVVPTYLPATRYGGPIYAVHGLCAALVALGHEVDVFTTSVDGSSDSEVPHGEPVLLDGVRVWYFGSRAGRRLYWAPTMRAALEATVPRVDCVHLHSVFLWPTNAAARVAAAKGVPYVISPRGMLVRELVERRSAWVKSAWLTLFESETLARAAHVHFTSEQERIDAQRLPLPIPAPCVVPNGVAPPAHFFAQRASARIQSITAGAPYVLFLGRIHWKKGLERTIRALRGTEMRLVICGPDDEGFAPRLRGLAHAEGVADRVRFEAPVTGDDKWALLAAARSVVLASDNENFGNVVPEAMLVGRPVVVSAHTGAREVVTRAGAGLVCELDDASLRSALLALWHDTSRGDALGAAGRGYAERELTWASVAERMAPWYGPTPARHAY